MTKRRFKSGKSIHRDLTLPGSRYTGPGGPLDNGFPKSASDAVSQHHDYHYQDYLDMGVDPYSYYNDADENALQNWGYDYPGVLAKAVFAGKKALVSRISDEDEERTHQHRHKRFKHGPFGTPDRTPRIIDNGISPNVKPIGMSLFNLPCRTMSTIVDKNQILL